MSGPAYRWRRVALIPLLVLLVIIAGCPAGPSATSKAEVQVPMVVLEPTNPETPVYGGTSRLRMTVEPNKDQELRVGFYESEVGGSGPRWQASGWMAVVMSSLLLGVDINSYKFSIDVAGQIDGASAGGLMTATLLSLLLGDTLKPEVSMTGTINPDGTIGPVFGIPQKLEGAAKAGKKLVLIPLGQRYDLDFKTGENIDVVEKGRRLGIEVHEVGDIYEAYEALTGKKLPKPEGISDQQPQLPSGAFEKVKSKAKEWDSRYEQQHGDFLRLAEANRQPFQNLQQQAEAANQKADSYSQQGLMSGAYSKNLMATLYMSLATERANMRANTPPQAQGLQPARDHLQTVHSVVITRLDGLTDRLKAEKPKTSTDALVLTDAYSSLATAMGLADLAEEVSKRNAENDDQRAQLLTTACVYYTMANHVAQSANDTLDMGLGSGTSPAPDPKRVARFAEILRQAAEANLNYFDAVVIDRVAKQRGVHPDIIRQEYQAVDFNYTYALATLRALPRLQERLGKGSEAAAYATLGAALASYQASSAVVVKYESLGVQLDDAGNITGVDRESAMIHMLDFAEKRARELIVLAQKTGNDPVQPIVHFDSAKISREGTLSEKISGLQYFWLSSLEAKLMAIFSGKFKTAR